MRRLDKEIKRAKYTYSLCEKIIKNSEYSFKYWLNKNKDIAFKYKEVSLITAEQQSIIVKKLYKLLILNSNIKYNIQK